MSFNKLTQAYIDVLRETNENSCSFCSKALKEDKTCSDQYCESHDVEDISIEEASGHTIEAYGVKGMKSIRWRKTFKNAEALDKWATENDAEVQGQRDLEKDSVDEAFVNNKNYTLYQIIKEGSFTKEGDSLVGEIGESSIIINGDEMTIYPKDDDTKKAVYRLTRVKE